MNDWVEKNFAKDDGSTAKREMNNWIDKKFCKVEEFGSKNT